ncbi:MAG: hypothetical protein Q8R04_05810 [Nanoarchaeota archaeon]|nr:hypothetical protein [Nanoarchaeota archaeon]
MYKRQIMPEERLIIASPDSVGYSGQSAPIHLLHRKIGDSHLAEYMAGGKRVYCRIGRGTVAVSLGSMDLERFLALIDWSPGNDLPLPDPSDEEGNIVIPSVEVVEALRNGRPFYNGVIDSRLTDRMSRGLLRTH